MKYEDVYLKAYETVSQARAGISRYFDFYNSRRPHSAHGGRTPDVVYFAALPATRPSSMSVEHGLPTASVVRSSQATPARRRGQPCTEADQTAADPLISAPDRVQTSGATSQIRAGRPQAIRHAIIGQVSDAYIAVTGADPHAVVVAVLDVPASWVMEGGQIMPEPGQEQ